MAILKNYYPEVHDIHLYDPDARRDPPRVGIPVAYNPNCRPVDWSGVSVRPRAFATPVPATVPTSGWTAPLDLESINFWNTKNPCAVLVSPRHALICQHYRGTQERQGETYQFMGAGGQKHTRTVVKATLDVGQDHTLLEFDAALPGDVARYSHIADVRYIPAYTRLWNHDCNGKGYQTAFGKAMVSAGGQATGFVFDPVVNGTDDGIKANGLPGIFVGDSGSPAFVAHRGQTLLVGLMYGGMQVNSTEIDAINALIGAHGYSVRHVRLSAKAEDLNQDGVVDGTDLGMAMAAWGNGNALADLNGDGNVDGADVGKILAAWGPYDMSPNAAQGGGGLAIGGGA